MLKTHFSKIKDVIIKPKYRWFFILWIIIFLAINIFVNEIYVVGASILNYSPVISIPYISFTLLNTFLVAISVNLIIARVRALKSLTSGVAGGLSAIGAFFALLTGACPGCIAGLFPIIIGLIGSPFQLTQLPLFGIELQIISTIFMLIGIYFLTKPFTCKIKITD